MITLTIFYLSFFCFSVVFLINYAIYSNKNLNIQKKLNLKLDDKIMRDNFVVSKEYLLSDIYSNKKNEIYKQKILIDEDSKKICFLDYENFKISIVNFSDILNYEIYSNGNSFSSGFGVGNKNIGLFTTSTKTRCRELSLIIRLKNYKSPQVKYNIIYKSVFNLGIIQTSKTYQNCYHNLLEVVSMLEVILDNNKTQGKNQ